MSRLTLRLPETLHERLELIAQQEGISLNQYIVYALTQQTSSAYILREIPAEKIAEQRASYNTRLSQARTATTEEIEQVFAEREPGVPEPELTPEVIKKARQRIASKRAEKTVTG